MVENLFFKMKYIQMEKQAVYWPANVIGLAEGELDKIAVTTKDKEHF